MVPPLLASSLGPSHCVYNIPEVTKVGCVQLAIILRSIPKALTISTMCLVGGGYILDVFCGLCFIILHGAHLLKDQYRIAGKFGGLAV